MLPAHRRTLAAMAVVTAMLALPVDAFACWSLCVETIGYEYRANGTTYELTSCTQTWPDGANNPHTVCSYTNTFRPTTRR